MHILITGTAGFIGFHLARRCLSEGHSVCGVDGVTDYYDVRLKWARLGLLERYDAFSAHKIMLEDRDALERTVAAHASDVIVHLAAQAGVRYSLENPRSYLDSNIVGTFNLMEIARKNPPRHFLFASTSSIYGANKSTPFREIDKTDHPMTFYAATKKASEDMAHSYAHLWRIPTTALRFFTVYGPWGRPDMALFKFVRAALSGEPIDVYGRGTPQRDFTYIDDIVEAVMRLIDHPPQQDARVAEFDSLSPVAPYRAVNIGAGRTVGLLQFIDEIEKRLGVPIQRRMLEMQKGDAPFTFASIDLLEKITGYRPTTSIQEGISPFIEWYKAHYETPAGASTDRLPA